MNILVPLDGSPLAEQALSSALLFAQRSQEPAALLLVRVNPSKETLLASGDMLAPEFARDHAADAIAYLEHVQQRISQQEVPVRSRSSMAPRLMPSCDMRMIATWVSSSWPAMCSPHWIARCGAASPNRWRIDRRSRR